MHRFLLSKGTEVNRSLLELEQQETLTEHGHRSATELLSKLTNISQKYAFQGNIPVISDLLFSKFMKFDRKTLAECRRKKVQDCEFYLIKNMEQVFSFQIKLYGDIEVKKMNKKNALEICNRLIAHKGGVSQFGSKVNYQSLKK